MLIYGGDRSIANSKTEEINSTNGKMEIINVIIPHVSHQSGRYLKFSKFLNESRDFCPHWIDVVDPHEEFYTLPTELEKSIQTAKKNNCERDNFHPIYPVSTVPIGPADFFFVLLNLSSPHTCVHRSSNLFFLEGNVSNQPQIYIDFFFSCKKDLLCFVLANFVNYVVSLR